jgi:hypothetical protein
LKIHPCNQGSCEWEVLRSGKVTASELDRLVSPKGKVRTGDGPTTYLYEKLAERWLGRPLPSSMNLPVWAVEQGRILEEWARPGFALETNTEVQQVGFITKEETGPMSLVGASPDGLIGDNCGLEIKCPRLQTHIGYISEGVLPEDYVLQVQGSLYVTGFPQWKFYSYYRKVPSLILTIEPDPDIQDAIEDALAVFLGKYEDAWAKLIELNGGVTPPRQEKMVFAHEMRDGETLPDENGIIDTQY